MIEGHGDDSYKFERPITANFSSNVYNRVDLSGLQAHLCSCISGISSYPEPEPILWKVVWQRSITLLLPLFV